MACIRPAGKLVSFGQLSIFERGSGVKLDLRRLYGLMTESTRDHAGLDIGMSSRIAATSRITTRCSDYADLLKAIR